MGHALTILFIFLSSGLFAADTVRVYDPTKLAVSGVTNAGLTLGVTAPSGDATSETAPARVYVPIQSGAVDQIKYSLFSLSGITTLFNTSLATHYLNYPLTLNIVTTGKYLYAAVKLSSVGTSYFVAARYSAVSLPTGADQNIAFAVSPNALCTALTYNSSGACSSLLPTSVVETAIKPMVYFFTSSEALAINGSKAIDPANYPGGVYFETQMSNVIYDSSELTISLGNTRVGDSRLFLTYSSSSTMDTSSIEGVKVFSHTASSITYSNVKDASIAGGGVLANEFGTSQSGELNVNNLVNSTDYFLSVFFVDKFKFATTLSPSADATPLKIEELLKKQACFILTAGFGEEHYVTNFFRQYRDKVLAHSWLGKKFIKFYYRSAPRYALMIYRHETIRSGIRGAAYMLYFFFNYYWAILLILIVSYLGYKKKNLRLISSTDS